MEMKRRSILKRFFDMQESSVLIAIVLFCIIITSINNVFISPDNLRNLLRSTGFTLITTLGMTFVLISGGLDLSVGSVYALGGTVCAKMLVAGLPVWVAFLGGVLIGFVTGIINGMIIVKINIPPLIVTLGMMYIARGTVYALTKGVPVYPLPEAFKAIEHTKIFGGLPMVVAVALVLSITAAILLKHTSYGRAVYAVGGNQDAARISGININRIKMSVYAITSSLAALVGILMTSRLGSAQASAGTGYEMTVIAAAIIGGTSTYAGVGTVFGSILGALFMEILSNSLTLMRVSVYWQNIVIGAILILAVALDTYRRILMQKRDISNTK